MNEEKKIQIFETVVEETTAATEQVRALKEEKKQKRQQMIKDFLKSYPVTLISIVICTVAALALYAVSMNFSLDLYSPFSLFSLENILIDLLIVGALFSVGSFFTESTFTSPLGRVLSWVLVALFAIGMMLYYNFDMLNLVSLTLSRYLSLTLLTYLLVLLILSVYFIARKSTLKFPEFVLGVSVNSIIGSAITSLITLAVMLIAAMMIFLLFPESDLIVYVFIGLAGFVVFPVELFILARPFRQTHPIARILPTYILFPVVLIGILVLYCYGITMFVTGHFPSNLLFPLCGIFYFFAALILCWVEAMNTDNIWKRLSFATYFLLIPVVLLQGYAIALRVLQYGFTPLRVVAVAILLLQVIYLFIRFLGEGKRKIIFAIAAVLAFLVILCPGFNMHHISCVSQTLILRDFMENPSEGTAERAYGAYDYLSDEEAENPLSIDRYSKEERDKLDKLFTKYYDGYILREQEQEPELYEWI